MSQSDILEHGLAVPFAYASRRRVRERVER